MGSDEDVHQSLTRESRDIWDAKAEFWDAGMGEGNLFHRELVGPAAERLLEVQPGELVLDVASGNGQFSRRMAQLGARVVATDFSARFLELSAARAGTEPCAGRIEFQQLDATDAGQLAALGARRFDAVVGLMALMDIATIEPLAQALPQLLAPGGRFVFAVMHPCFNSAAVRFVLEEEDRDGEIVETYSVKMAEYLNLPVRKGAGMPGEPEPHYYFHRPLHALFGPFFRAGLVTDGVEEPAFGPEVTSRRAISWASFNEIPPVFAARMVVRDASPGGVGGP